MKAIKRTLKVIVIVLSFLVAYFGYHAVAIWNYGNLDERQPADAIVVLGAAAWHTNPSPVFQERIRHGIWLYENGYADYLIFTGGHGDGAPYSESYVARRYAIAAGVPEEAILIEEYSRTTEENFSYSLDLMNDRQINRIVLVSDPFHMRRAVRVAEDFGLTVYSSPTPTTRYETLNTQIPFLSREVIFYIGYQLGNLF